MYLPLVPQKKLFSANTPWATLFQEFLGNSLRIVTNVHLVVPTLYLHSTTNPTHFLGNWDLLSWATLLFCLLAKKYIFFLNYFLVNYRYTLTFVFLLLRRPLPTPVTATNSGHFYYSSDPYPLRSPPPTPTTHYIYQS